MTSNDRSKICRPSRRGHSWRELTPDEQDKHMMVHGPKRGNATVFSARACTVCGALGYVTAFGLIALGEAP